ncbi:MAG: radical SAM protein [Synergistaceae bacterium]|jgi:radical SAM protein with 4Fe4S-binding SPASM domain|nr:radical SAM protein [Synergistaceae bacterium]
MMAQIARIFNSDRVPLWEVIPLDTPFVIEIEPTSFCNLQCKYCLHSLPKQKISDSGHKFLHMNDDVFDLLLKQTIAFPGKVKQIGFAGMGEPLLHKRLPYMIEQFKDRAGIERVTITTNGIALTHQLTDSLLSSGLCHIKISVNGLSSEDFMRNCGATIDFDKYLEQIDYLYKNKGSAVVACKIMDSCVGDAEDTFFSMFGDKCDAISVEKTVRVFHEVAYDGIIEADKEVLSRYDIRKNRVHICASPFFRFAVKADGTVSACRLYNGLTHKSFKIQNNTLPKIWNSDERREMLLGVLKEKTDGLNSECNNCTLRDDFAFESDLLDDHAGELYQRILAH